MRYTYVATFLGNGATSARNTVSCTTTSSSCEISAPDIIRNGYEIVGWASSADATSSRYAIGDKIRLTGNTTFYAVTYATFSASFTVQDSAAVSKSGGSTSCRVYNRESSCNITAPTLTANSGYDFKGWNTLANTTDASLASGADLTLYSSSVKYYSITYNTTPLIAKFVISNPVSATKTGGITTCTLWNGATECSLTAPRLIPNESYSVDGWYDPELDWSLASGESFLISPAISGTTFYAVTRSTLEYSVTFNLRDSAHFSMSTETLSCAPVDGSCSIAVPTITTLDPAYSFLGWTLDPSSTDATSLEPTLTLTAENSGYAYYSVSKRLTPLTVSFKITDQVHFPSIEPFSVTCELYNGTSSCSVPISGVDLGDGFVFDGWSSTSGSTATEFSAGAEVSFSSDTTLFSVSHESTPLSATFVIQNTSSSRFADETTAPKTLECYKFNGASSCSVAAPSFSANSGYTVYGWDENPNTEDSAMYKSGDQILLTDASKTFYSIISNSFQITYETQDSAHLTFAGGNTSVTQNCSLKTQSECTVSFPEATVLDRDFIGWTTTKGGTSVEYSPTDTPTVTSATIFYAITKKDITLTFELLDTTNFYTPSSLTSSCTFYNSTTSCSLSAPSVSPRYTNFKLLGWSTTSGSTTYSWNGAAQDFSESANYYSVTRYNIQIGRAHV